MVKVPTPGEEDSRQLCRERKALTAERVRHVNRIKGLLFSQGISGYQPLRSDRRQRLEELKTGDGRAFPPHLKALVNRELDRLELLLEPWRPRATRCWLWNKRPSRRRQSVTSVVYRKYDCKL
jgi:transposase